MPSGIFNSSRITSSKLPPGGYSRIVCGWLWGVLAYRWKVAILVHPFYIFIGQYLAPGAARGKKALRFRSN